MIDLGFVIDEEGGPVTLKAKTGGAYDADGKWVSQFAAPQTIRAVVQPAKGTQLRDLEEGVRKEAQFLLWTRSAVALDDVVNYGGADYRVVFLWPRPEGGFTRAALGLLR